MQSQGNSNAMELIGFKEALHDILVEWKLRVHEFTSDRHMQIRKYMRETYGENRKDKSQPLIHHYFDLWHCAKSMLWFHHVYCEFLIIIIFHNNYSITNFHLF